MRKLIAWVFLYSLDGLLADEGTPYWEFCFGLHVDPAQTRRKVDLYESAYAHIMGRVAYEAMAESLPKVPQHHERRAQGRLLPHPDDGRVGQHHHRRW